MKILHIFDHSIPLHSGYTFRSKSIIDQQRLLGFETCHLTGSKHGIHDHRSTNSFQTVDGLSFYRSSKPPGWIANNRIFQQIYVVVSLLISLNRVVRVESPDILHAHSPALNGFATLLIGNIYSIPVVYEIRAFWEDAAVDHGTTTEKSIGYKISQKFEEFVVKRANGLVTICSGLMNDLKNRCVLPKNIAVVANAVDANKYSFRYDSLVKRISQPEHVVVIGFVGSFYRYEGLDILLNAFKKLSSIKSNVRLCLVGGGPEDHALRTTVKEYGLSHLVEMPGRVPHSEVEKAYEMIDILVYPRRCMRLTETVTPLKPLEAMAMGRPMVVSDVGGHKELLPDISGSVVVKSNSVESLSEGLANYIDLLTTTSDYSFLVKAREYVLKEKNWKRSVSNYIPLYDSILRP